MKKYSYTIFALFALFATSTYAQNIIPRNAQQYLIMVPCDTSAYIKNLIEVENSERLLFDAEGLVFTIPSGGRTPEPAKAPASLYVNMESGRWSLVLKPTDRIWCLLVNGSEFVAGGN